MTKSICSEYVQQNIWAQRNWCVNSDKSFHEFPGPPAGCLNEVTWTVYAIFKRAGRVSCTLEMWSGENKQEMAARVFTSPCVFYMTLASFTPNLLTALTCVSPFNLSSSVFIWDCSSGLLSSPLNVYGVTAWKKGREFNIAASDTKHSRALGNCSSRCCDKNLVFHCAVEARCPCGWRKNRKLEGGQSVPTPAA